MASKKTNILEALTLELAQELLTIKFENIILKRATYKSVQFQSYCNLKQHIALVFKKTTDSAQTNGEHEITFELN